MPLDRAQEALEAVEVCLQRRFHHSATSRAYYGMFWAAQLALGRIGIRRSEWSHPALQASFVGELIRRRKRYPAMLGQHLNRALQLRLDADYRLKGVSLGQATQAVRWARDFVSAVASEVSDGATDPEAQ